MVGEGVGQVLGEVRVDIVDEPTRDEEVEPQAPVVVAGPCVVETEDVRPAAQPRRGIRQPRPARLHERTDDVLEVRP
jgi:hypothetical protein